MKRCLLSIVAVFGGAAWCCAADFHPPVRVEAGGKVIRVEAPGYAYPCLVDLDGKGKKDLVVGQFAGGKMKVYKMQSDGKFAEGVWLQAGGAVAEVPGVW